MNKEPNRTKYLTNVVKLPHSVEQTMLLNGADMSYRNVQQDRNIFINDGLITESYDAEWQQSHRQQNLYEVKPGKKQYKRSKTVKRKHQNDFYF